ncbi:NMD protein [Culex quinquefasciatus]|uniref:NMD protein n=1 Tax=Culex quinquefasciatus TaxID=7176 RepID=B0WYX5_CULQU|nr:NMD protein [Culex quinquefasciatus]|eukprot:XP_001862597.1 NMD protein [Culex quinquefasciatus]
MVEFVVTDMEIDRDNKMKNFPRQGPVSFRHVLADFWVCPNWAHTRAHLGHILKMGDSVLGYDLAEANDNGNFEKLKLDAMHKQSRNWKLKHLTK